MKTNSKDLENIALQITEALDGLLPEDVRCVFVLTTNEDVFTASDMSDEDSLRALQEGIETIKSPKGLENIETGSFPKNKLN